VTDFIGARQQTTTLQAHVPSTSTTDDYLIREEFDRRLSSVMGFMVTPSSAAIDEVRQYVHVEEANIGRHEDPLV